MHIHMHITCFVYCSIVINDLLLQAIPDNMDRTKGDGEEGPPQFVKFGKSSSTRNSNTNAAAKIKDKSVELRHQSSAEEVSTREKMELPPSYNTQGASGGRSGEAMNKDSTSLSSSLSKDDVKIASQIRELSLAAPHAVDIENVVKPYWSGRGLGRVDQGSVRARVLGGFSKSRHGGRSRESGRTQMPPVEDGQRERRVRGRRQRDSEDDYCPRGRKETYLLSEFFEIAGQSSGRGEGGGGGGNKEEDVLKDYIYDEQTDQYYPRGTTPYGGVVGMHFSNDDNFVANVSNRDTQHYACPNRGVEYDERSFTNTFVRGAGRRGRGSCFYGSEMEWNSPRTSRGGRDGSNGGWKSEGRYERRGKGRGSEGWGKDDSRVKTAGEGRHAKVRDECGPGSMDRKNQDRDDQIKYGGITTIQSSSYCRSSAKHFNAHSDTAGEGCHGMAEQETFRQKNDGRTRQYRDNYLGSRDDYRQNSDWHRSSSTRRGERMHESRGRDATREKEEVRYDHDHPYSTLDSAPSAISHWDYLAQLETVGVPASAVKSAKTTNKY